VQGSQNDADPCGFGSGSITLLFSTGTYVSTPKIYIVMIIVTTIGRVFLDRQRFDCDQDPGFDSDPTLKLGQVFKCTYIIGLHQNFLSMVNLFRNMYLLYNNGLENFKL
jgi:hypothetical protein